MRYDLHGVVLELDSPDMLVRERITASLSSLSTIPNSYSARDIHFTLGLTDTIPPSPEGDPDYAERDLIHYYIRNPLIIAQLPRYGQLQIALDTNIIRAKITPTVITTYGVFEDLLAMGLSPLLRRRGQFLLHAFAAAYEGRAALLVGDIGAGKTTTGIALVRAGWKLLSNDSPLLDAATTRVHRYPGLLSGYSETLARFPELHQLMPGTTERRKVTFAAEAVYSDVWCDSADPALLLFPSVQNIPKHRIERLSEPDALRMLLPHAVERWDTEMIPSHLALLTRLCARTPAYTLALAPDTDTIPDLVRELLIAPR